MAESSFREFDLRELVRALRRRWIIIVAVVAVLVGASLVRSYLEEPVYQATAEVELVVADTDAAGQSRSRSATEAQRAVDTEIQKMRSVTLRREVAQTLGRSPRVSASGQGNTDVIAIRALSNDAQQAADDANAFANAYIEARTRQTVDDLARKAELIQEQIDAQQAGLDELGQQLELVELELIGTPLSNEATRSRLEGERDELTAAIEAQRIVINASSLAELQDRLRVNVALSQLGGARLVSEATPPRQPIKPTPMRNAMGAAFLGLVLGIGAALLREYWDDSIKAKTDLESVAPGLAVVGLIPHVSGWRDKKSAEVVTRSQPSSPAAEAYRSLRTSIRFLGIDRPIGTLQVTSSIAGEGKSTTAANTAVAFARAGARVIVVDCDLRRPRLHQFFDLANTVGFTSVLLGETTVKDAVQAVPGEDRLLVMAAGPIPPNPSELLSTPRAGEVLSLLAENADIVVIDSPPVIPVTDAMVMSGVVDATVLVATAGLTTKRAFGRSVELLEQVGAPLVGAILNDVAEKSFGDHYGYQYGYASAEAGPSSPLSAYANGNGNKTGRTDTDPVAAARSEAAGPPAAAE
jgi:polysaccharide biosynthesis transport protein